MYDKRTEEGRIVNGGWKGQKTCNLQERVRFPQSPILENKMYGIEIRWSYEEDEFIGKVPLFPGLSAFGETRAECLKEVEIVLKMFIETEEK